MTCPHCDIVFHGCIGVNTPSNTIYDGCVGVCAHCLMWWKYTGGQLVKYEPTIEEQAMVVLELLHRKRMGISQARNN